MDPPETRGAKKAAALAAALAVATDPEAVLRARIARGAELDREQFPWFYKMDHY